MNLRTKLALVSTLTLPVLLSTPAIAGDRIVPVRENGRVVYVNDAAQAVLAPQSAPRPQLVYWSQSEKRWKPVPPAAGRTMRAARSAAAEVSRAIFVPEPPAPGSKTRAIAYRTMSQQELDAIIEAAAARHQVDPNLVRAVIKVESNFNPAAISRKGAMGLMQLMPSTARSLNVNNAFDPAQNVDAGVRHLRGLLDSFDGNVRLSLAAYNAGSTAVQKHGTIPPYRETRSYVQRITQIYAAAPEGERLMGNPAAPIRVFRDASGNLRITNVD